MSTEALPRIVGLTGGIASGKSTVSNMFRELGVLVIDADEVARDVVKPGTPGLDAIVAAFGDDVLDPAGNLDRARLGSIIFADPSARRTLNEITHPRIAMEMMSRASRAGQDGHSWVIYDAALIVENGIHHMLNGLIVVVCTPDVQLQRLMHRDGFTEADAQERIASQLPLAQKVDVADWVIDNGGTLDETASQVRRVFDAVEAQ